MAGAVGLFWLAGACSDLSSGGPLDRGNDAGSLCAPVFEDGKVTIGIETLRNSGSEPAEIESVRMVDSVGMSLIDAKVMKLNVVAVLIGVQHGYPPERISEWSIAVSAGDAVIPPGDEDEAVFNLVVGLEMDPDPRHSDLFRYRGHVYRWKTAIRLHDDQHD